MKPFFSILIPVYKNTQYLEKCIDSIFEQSFKSFEILLCVQGDTDLSAIRFPKTVVILRLEEPSSYLSRILLFREAKGEYVWFVDSDDIIHPNALQILYNCISNTSFADIYHFSYDTLYNDAWNHKKNALDNLNINFKARDEYLSSFLLCEQYNPVWRKCFKNKEITFFDADIFMADDGLLSLSFILKAQKVVELDIELYGYRIHENSGARTKKEKHFYDLCLFLNQTIPYRKTHEEFEYLFALFAQSYVDYYRVFRKKFLKDKNVSNLLLLIKHNRYKLRPRLLNALFISATKNNSLLFGVLDFFFKVQRKLCSRK